MRGKGRGEKERRGAAARRSVIREETRSHDVMVCDHGTSLVGRNAVVDHVLLRRRHVISRLDAR